MTFPKFTEMKPISLWQLTLAFLLILGAVMLAPPFWGQVPLGGLTIGLWVVCLLFLHPMWEQSYEEHKAWEAYLQSLSPEERELVLRYREEGWQACMFFISCHTIYQQPKPCFTPLLQAQICYGPRLREPTATERWGEFEQDGWSITIIFRRPAASAA